eukprot:TRINITY_DN579_c0_g1_i1.p1 TRINITY_DN579_c0_g1~~TRINITY_DN579_c0_g1_i1.p1  ORF type:complete len:552 (+),score=117.72 TRINITY_DN579_c0_g1_i1:198-1853(+)
MGRISRAFEFRYHFHQPWIPPVLNTLQSLRAAYVTLCCLCLVSGVCLWHRRRRHGRREAAPAGGGITLAQPGNEDPRRLAHTAENARAAAAASSARVSDDAAESERLLVAAVAAGRGMSMTEILEQKDTLGAATVFQMKREWLLRELKREQRQQQPHRTVLTAESPSSSPEAVEVVASVGEDSRHSRAGAVQIIVRRDHILKDSFAQLEKLSSDDLKKPISVNFVEEIGRDDGGITRDWFSALSREIFNPAYGLFTPSAADDYTFQINPLSGVNPEHLEYFCFIGKIVGKALQDGCLLDANFTRLVYKRLLGKEVTYDDMASVDVQFYRSLVWLLENQIEDLDLGLTFTVDKENFGAYEEVELKPGGAAITLTEENKEEYVNLLADWRLQESVEEQFRALREGMACVVHPELLKHFDEVELEWLVGGLVYIDIEDWRRNTVYKAGYSDSPDCHVIQWLWQLIEAWDQEMRARLLQFVTGTSKVPYPEGFKGLKGSDGPRMFHIVRVTDFTRLPQAHTCFNELILPDYYSFELLAANLHMAIFETGSQFQLR